MHFECPASPAALEEAKRVRRPTAGPFTPYYAATERTEDAIDASSDPEDEAGARGYNMAAVAPAEDLQEAVAPVNYLLLNRAQPAPAPLPYGVAAAALVDRGDGFGFELAEQQDQMEAAGGNCPVQHDHSNHGDGREHSD